MASKDQVGANVRMAALLVSALVKASDDELEAFLRKRQLSGSEAQLRVVRDLVRELFELLKDGNDERWDHVLTAHEAIVGGGVTSLGPRSEIDDALAGEHDDDESDASEMQANSHGLPALVDKPPTLEALLGAADVAPPSVHDFPPSPWVSPTRALEAKTPPQRMPPATPLAPLPPPRVGAPAAHFPTPAAEPTPVPASLERPTPLPSEPPVTGTTEIPPAPLSEAPPPRPLTDPPQDEDALDDPAESRPRSITLPPMARSDHALPFALPPEPSMPGLAPEELAHMLAGQPAMTVVSYAALTASCEVMPQRVAATHAKFGVTDSAARGMLDAAWRTKLERDPRLQALFNALRHQFSAWLSHLR